MPKRRHRSPSDSQPSPAREGAADATHHHSSHSKNRGEHPPESSQDSSTSPVCVEPRKNKCKTTQGSMPPPIVSSSAHAIPPSAPSSIAHSTGPSIAPLLATGILMTAPARSTAEDVWAFLRRGTLRQEWTTCARSASEFSLHLPGGSLCKVSCRSPHILSRLRIDADGPEKHVRLVWKYKPRTSISNLHDHLQCLHPKAYVEKCTQNKWPNMIKSLCPTVTTQTSIKQFTQVGVKPCPNFSTSSFRSVVVKWIVADDQVSQPI